MNIFWTNTDGGTADKTIAASIQQILDRSKKPDEARNNAGRTGGRANRSAVRVQSRDELRSLTQTRADDIIWSLSKLPLITLLVCTLGVVNTVLSSIRARRWDLGVLRAVGVTRWGICQLVLSEAILVGLSACALSLGFGVMAGYCGAGVSRYVDVHGGAVTPLVIPWVKLSVGFGATLVLCLIASLLPAIITARTEPLQLLTAGRGSGAN